MASLNILMARVGFEPTTHGLKVRCSTPELPCHRGFYTSKYLKKNKANLNQKGVSTHQRFYFYVSSHRYYTDCPKAPINITKTFVYLSI